MAALDRKPEVTNFPSAGTNTGHQPHGVTKALDWAWFFRFMLTTFFPVVAGLVAHFLGMAMKIPGWSAPVGLFWPDLHVWPMLVGMMVVLSAWLYYNISFVRSMDTTVRELIRETEVSVVMALISVFILGLTLAQGSLYLSMILPIAYQVMDGYQTVKEALNNAAQKPIMQTA